MRFNAESINAALTFAEKNTEKTAIINIRSAEELNKARLSYSLLRKFAKNLSNILYDFWDIKMIQEAENDLPLMYHQPIMSYEVLHLLNSLNCFHVVLGEPFLFNTNINLHKDFPSFVFHAYPIPYINDIYTSINTLQINRFFVLPQNIKHYENLIDVLELIDNNIERERALCNMYAQKPTNFTQDISVLIPNIGTHIPSSIFDGETAIKRTTCGHRCVHSLDNSYCRYCFRLVDLYDKVIINK